MQYDHVDDDWEVFAGSNQIAKENTREAARKTALEVDTVTDVRLAWPYFECEECGKIFPHEGDMNGATCLNQDCRSDRVQHLCGPKNTETGDQEWPDHDHDSNVDYFFEEVLNDEYPDHN